MTVLRALRWLTVLEFAVYRNLFRWVSRRPDVPSGGLAFTHISPVAALLWVFIAVSAVETLVLHVALPWPGVRLTVDILSLWGLLWMLGLVAASRVRPHVVSDDGVHVRSGLRGEFVFRWDDIATIAVRERSLERSRAIQLHHAGDAAVFSVAVAGRTNVDVTLRQPVIVTVTEGLAPATHEAVTQLRFYVDDAKAMVAATREFAPG